MTGDDFVEPTLEKEWAGRPAAVDRAARAEEAWAVDRFLNGHPDDCDCGNDCQPWADVEGDPS